MVRVKKKEQLTIEELRKKNSDYANMSNKQVLRDAKKKAYKEAGANGIMIAEPLAGMLSPTMEAEFSAPFVKRIVEELQDENFLVIYHNCGDNTIPMIDSILTIGASAYHFGNSINMEEKDINSPLEKIMMG